MTPRAATEALTRTCGLLEARPKLDWDLFDGPHAWSNRKTLPFLARHWGHPVAP